MKQAEGPLERENESMPTRQRKTKNKYPGTERFVASRSGKVIARSGTLGGLMADKNVIMLLPSKDVVISHEAPEGMIVAYRSTVPV